MGKHSEWRRLAKNARRKRIRQKLAQARDRLEKEEQKSREEDPQYQKWLAEIKEAREKQAESDTKLAAELDLKWQNIEIEAQKQFKELQQKLAKAKEERARQNELIKLEWEKEQQKLKEKKEKEKKEQQERIDYQEHLNELVNNFLCNGGSTPEHLKTSSETNPNKQLCPFFKKTGTCRFFDVCSRNHVRLGITRIILIPNFYSHYSLEKTESDEISDSSLEFEHSETYAHYKEFFFDVVHELEKFGMIKFIKTCSNHEAHLRGNVFVEYMTKREALICYRGLNGRWYGGKQLSLEFCNIQSWRSALCGLNFYRRCPKGSACNFLHVLHNPNNLYNKHEESKRYNQESYDSLRNTRWSESPEHVLNYSSESKCSGHRDKNHSRHKRDSLRDSRRKHCHNGLRSRSSSTKFKRCHTRSRSRTRE